MHRRNFIGMLAAPAFAAPPRGDVVPDYEKPLFQLHKLVPSPVKIASIELLRNGREWFVRSRSTDGVTGIVRTKQIEDFIPILLRRVSPECFVKDAGGAETLIDG